MKRQKERERMKRHGREGERMRDRGMVQRENDRKREKDERKQTIGAEREKESAIGKEMEK